MLLRLSLYRPDNSAWGKKSGHRQLWGCFGICSSSVHLLTPYLPEQKTGRAPSLQRPRTPSRALRFGCNELSVCGPLKCRRLNHNPWCAGIGDGPLGGSLVICDTEDEALELRQVPSQEGTDSLCSLALPSFYYYFSFFSSSLLSSLSFIRIQKESTHLQVLNGNQISWHLFYFLNLSLSCIYQLSS